MNRLIGKSLLTSGGFIFNFSFSILNSSIPILQPLAFRSFKFLDDD
jgi:hypothetical protein